MTPRKLKAIKARCEQLNKPEVSQGDIWKKIGLCCELASKDLPDCIEEVERLQKLAEHMRRQREGSVGEWPEN